jgi:hypothetical protein
MKKEEMERQQEARRLRSDKLKNIITIIHIKYRISLVKYNISE